MPIYQRRRPGTNAGVGVGVVCLNQNMPFIPGDVQCATSFSFPVTYKVAEEGTSARILAGDERLEGWLIDTAKALELEGVRAISGDSGYMISYQKAVANAVDVPVALSSLVQVPLVASMLYEGRSIAVICAASPPLDEAYLQRSGVSVKNALVVKGMQDDEAVVDIMFKAVNIADHGEAGTSSEAPDPFDADRLAESFYQVGRRINAEIDDLGAIILECSDFPPYAAAVQAGAAGVPVFDYISMINLLESGTARTRFSGRT